MGRYAFFDTGVEYKFWFAVQPSDDITCFGGRRVTRMEWNAEEDLKYTMKELKELVEKYNYTLPEFEAYEKNEEGTRKLYRDVASRYELKEQDAKFCLGCIIYHQLTYKPNLTCDYEE